MLISSLAQCCDLLAGGSSYHRQGYCQFGFSAALADVCIFGAWPYMRCLPVGKILPELRTPKLWFPKPFPLLGIFNGRFGVLNLED